MSYGTLAAGFQVLSFRKLRDVPGVIACFPKGCKGPILLMYLGFGEELCRLVFERVCEHPVLGPQGFDCGEVRWLSVHHSAMLRVPIVTVTLSDLPTLL